MYSIYSIFQDVLKIGKIIPIFKKNNINDPNNYRLMYILPIFSKVFETILKKRLVIFFLKKNNLFSQCQYGFRNNKITQNALTTTIDYTLLNGVRSQALQFFW